MSTALAKPPSSLLTIYIKISTPITLQMLNLLLYYYPQVATIILW